jgi:hypothetical protein
MEIEALNDGSQNYWINAGTFLAEHEDDNFSNTRKFSNSEGF